MKSRLLIVLIFAVAFGLGGYGWWHNYRQGHRSLQLWGSDSAVLIRFAPRVLLLDLSVEAKSNSRSEVLEIDGQRFTVVRQVNIEKVPGLVHARHALIEDASFAWSNAEQPGTPAWQFALRFFDEDQQATIAFDTNCNQVRLIERDRVTRLLAEQMQAFDRKRQDWAIAGKRTGPERLQPINH